MNHDLLERAAVGISLPPQGTYVCEAVTFAEDLGQGTYAHVVDLRFSEGSDGFSAILITDEPDLATYVGQKVIASFRGEAMEGVNILRIQKLSIVQLVTTLDKTDGIRLYLKEIPESKSTVIFSDVTEENPVYQGIVFAANATVHTSSKSDWVEYDIIDKHNKHAVCRLFNPEPNSEPITGRYVKCDLSFDSRYGYRSTYMESVRDLGTYVDPTVVICKDYLTAVISSCAPNFQKMLMESQFIDKLYNHAADTTLFEAAAACHMAQDFENISGAINLQHLTEAVLMQYLYVAVARGNDFISSDLTSAILLLKYNAQSQERLNAIDVGAPKVYLESQLAKNLVATAKLLVETERKTNPGSKVVACM